MNLLMNIVFRSYCELRLNSTHFTFDTSSTINNWKVYCSLLERKVASSVLININPPSCSGVLVQRLVNKVYFTNISKAWFWKTGKYDLNELF